MGKYPSFSVFHGSIRPVTADIIYLRVVFSIFIDKPDYYHGYRCDKCNYKHKNICIHKAAPLVYIVNLLIYTQEIKSIYGKIDL